MKPFIYTCEHCGSEYNITDPGKYECSTCNNTFIIEDIQEQEQLHFQEQQKKLEEIRKKALEEKKTSFYDNLKSLKEKLFSQKISEEKKLEKEKKKQKEKQYIGKFASKILFSLIIISVSAAVLNLFPLIPVLFNKSNIDKIFWAKVTVEKAERNYKELKEKETEFIEYLSKLTEIQEINDTLTFSEKESLKIYLSMLEIPKKYNVKINAYSGKVDNIGQIEKYYENELSQKLQEYNKKIIQAKNVYYDLEMKYGYLKLMHDHMEKFIIPSLICAIFALFFVVLYQFYSLIQAIEYNTRKEEK